MGKSVPKMSLRRPLQEKDIPELLRGSLDLSAQFIVPIRGNEKYGGHLRVQRTCLSCKEVRPVQVSLIRHAIQRGSFTGLCASCSTKVVRKRKASYKTTGQLGSKRKTRWGYVEVYFPSHPHANANGCVMEHRLVVEATIGRFLENGETVHHKNGVRNDNRPENLELWQRSQPAGVRASDQLPHCPTCTCSFGHLALEV